MKMESQKDNPTVRYAKLTNGNLTVEMTNKLDQLNPNIRQEKQELFRGTQTF